MNSHVAQSRRATALERNAKHQATRKAKRGRLLRIALQSRDRFCQLASPDASPRKLRSHFSTSMAAGSADEVRLDVRGKAGPCALKPASGARHPEVI